MKLPDGLVQRIDRLRLQSDVLEKLQNEVPKAEKTEHELPSGASSMRDISPLAGLDVRRPLEDLQQALIGVKAEQNTIRRMQEEELVELCKLRHLLEIEQEKQKDKEQQKQVRKQQEAAEAAAAAAAEAAAEAAAKAASEAAAEAAKAAAATLELERRREALRVQQALLSQGARREEFLQAELRQLDQEEHQIQQKSLELKRQAEAIEAIDFQQDLQQDFSSPSFTPQPKIAVSTTEALSLRCAASVAPATTATATTGAASAAGAAGAAGAAVAGAAGGPRVSPVASEAPWADVASFSTISTSQRVEEPVALAGRQLVAGQGPLWQLLD